MRTSTVKPVTFLIATVLILLASSLPQAFASIVISYDNGTRFGGWTFQFVGVEFSLPSGVVSARLLTIQYVVGSFGAETLHITAADHVTELTGSPIVFNPTTTCPACTFQDEDVSGLGIVVTGDFFVILQLPGAFSTLQLDTSGSTTRSFGGASLAGLTTLAPDNLLLRVVIDPISTPTPPIPEYPYGVSLLAIFMLIGYGLVRRKTITKRK